MTLVLVGGWLVPPAPAQAEKALDREAVERIIREYLLKNPEIMVEVQQALEAKQKAERDAQIAATLNQRRDTIFNSANQGVIGPKDAPITIVEFFDYNCSFCQRAMEDMNVLLGNEKDVKFVLKELPILGPESVEASRISTAVYRAYPDKYGEFHNKLLGLEGIKNGERALAIARDMGLDTKKLEEIGARGDVLDAFREANALATSLGINGTPSYVLADEVVFGALGHAVLAEKLTAVRKCGKTSC
ncbi:MAG: DsbA family protein [Pseudomonadota bacterium]